MRSCIDPAGVGVVVSVTYTDDLDEGPGVGEEGRGRIGDNSISISVLNRAASGVGALIAAFPDDE